MVSITYHIQMSPSYGWVTFASLWVLVLFTLALWFLFITETMALYRIHHIADPIDLPRDLSQCLSSLTELPTEAPNAVSDRSVNTALCTVLKALM